MKASQVKVGDLLAIGGQLEPVESVRKVREGWEDFVLIETHGQPGHRAKFLETDNLDTEARREYNGYEQASYAIKVAANMCSGPYIMTQGGKMVLLYSLPDTNTDASCDVGNTYDDIEEIAARAISQISGLPCESQYLRNPVILDRALGALNYR